MIKHFFAAASLAVSMISLGTATDAANALDLAAVAHAEASEQQFTGNWYDAKGNFIISIQPGAINGCRIIRAYDVKGTNPGSGHYVILEANGEHDLFIEWGGGYWENNTYVEPHITVNHGAKLSRKA